MTRWEIGETWPSPEEWSRLAAFFVRRALEAGALTAAELDEGRARARALLWVRKSGHKRKSA